VTAFQERAPGYSVGSLYTVSSLLHGATSACTVAASVLRDAAAATVHSDPTVPCRTCMRRVSVKQRELCEPEPPVLCNTCKRECNRTSKLGVVPSGLRCEADASILADLGVGNETFRQLQDLEDREIDPNDYDVLMRLARKPSTKTLDLSSLASVCETFIAEAEQDLDSCTICLCALSAGEELIRVGCDARHVFHSQCIAEWLTKSSTCCPIDQQDLSAACLSA